ncbi:MAG: oxidoreductase [Gemmatales bacterium]|nr:MAG: oxidoreductase [Gemmatales bacterium]
MRLALIGLKGHQGVVVRGASQLGDVEIVAVADDVKGQAERFKQRERLAKKADVYTDWRHLLDHAMMDVCCVCDENGIRAEQIIALAERNIHIVTEKPLATSLEDLDRIRKALAKSKSKLTMLLTMRHEAKYIKMRELVKNGTIGEVCLVTAQKSYRLGNRPDWFKERKRLGGTIPYIGIHPIDLIRWITGMDYTRAAAFHGRIGRPEMKETENHASVLLQMSNGASVTARLDYLRPETAPSHGDDRLRIAGTEGVIEARYGQKELSLITSKKKPFTVAPGQATNLFAEYLQAVRNNKPLPIATDDCIYVTDVVLRARQAADEHKVVEIPRQK